VTSEVFMTAKSVTVFRDATPYNLVSEKPLSMSLLL
jgi:hypothetical protein